MYDVYESVIDFLRSFVINSESNLFDQLTRLNRSEEMSNNTPNNIDHEQTKEINSDEPDLKYDLNKISLLSKTGIPGKVMYSEALTVQILRTLSTRFVRFPGRGNTNHVEHRIESIESSDFMTKLGNIINQYNNLNDAESQNIQAHSHIATVNHIRRAISHTFDEKFHQAQSAVENIVHIVSTSALSSHSPSGGSKMQSNVSISSLNSSLQVKAANDKREEDILIALLIECIPYVRNLFYRRSSEMRKDSNNEAETDRDKRESIDQLSSSKLLSPAEYLTWLMEEGRLANITKPPDSAFQGTRLYYKYKDPWEVQLFEFYYLLVHKRFRNKMNFIFISYLFYIYFVLDTRFGC
jgi:hypothetical protein